MPSTPDVLDRAVRALLRVPGLVVEWIDGEPVVPAGPEPEALARRVRENARHPEAYLALEPDLHHLDHGDAVLAWQHRGRTAFGIGGLNVAPSGRVALLVDFVRATAGQGISRRLLFPLRTAELDHAATAGFDAVQVGVEARLDLGDMTLRGKRFENVRQMRNRALSRGVRVDEEDPAVHRDELAEVHATWLRAKRPSWRMKLLVGSPNLDRPLDRRYLVARTGERVEGFVTLLPGPDGVWGVDVMCRRPDAVPGTMELLLVRAVEQLRSEGVRQLSLGACPMAGVPVRADRPLLSRVLRWLFRSTWGNRLFGFQSLFRFKDKFQPRWEPVYFAAHPHLGWGALYLGCRMWGLY